MQRPRKKHDYTSETSPKITASPTTPLRLGLQLRHGSTARQKRIMTHENVGRRILQHNVIHPTLMHDQNGGTTR